MYFDAGGVAYCSFGPCNAKPDAGPVMYSLYFQLPRLIPKVLSFIKMENSKEKGAAEKKPDGQQPDYSLMKIVIGVVCIYIATMIISGGLTYYLTTPKDPTKKENNGTAPVVLTPEQVKGTVDEIEKNNSSPVIPIIPASFVFPTDPPDSACTTTCAPTYSCSDPCVKVVPSCKPRDAAQNATCPQYCVKSCDAQNNSCTAYPLRPFASISAFLNSPEEALAKYTVVDLLNNFPPFSKDRFLAVTKILQDTAEKWAESGFVHRCNEDLRTKPTAAPWENTKCSFCNDRYDYIKCIMQSNKLTQRDPLAVGTDRNNPIPVTDLLYFPERGNLYSPSADLLPLVIMTTGGLKLQPGVRFPDNASYSNFAKPMNDLLKMLFREIQKTTRSLWVMNDEGKACRVCQDFNVTMYNKCLQSGLWNLNTERNVFEEKDML